MSKKNFFINKITKIVLPITKRIESFFNFFNTWNSDKNKYSNLKKYLLEKKIHIASITIFFAIITYFSLPSFYDINKVKTQLENQILQEYNFEVKLNNDPQYRLFPKPHFLAEGAYIKHDSKIISSSKNTKFFISIKNFFKLNKIVLKNIIFINTDFNIDSSSLNFFSKLLSNEIAKKNLHFLKSKLFYLDQNENVIFFTSVKKLLYSYENELFNQMKSKLEVFNLPVSLLSRHDLINKIIFTEINLNSIKLKIENNLNYKNNNIAGELKLNFINNSETVNYNLENKNLTYAATDRNIKGEINIKPFFLSSNLEFKNLKIKKVFDEDSIIVNLLKSEILNNKNLNGKISVIINNLDDLKHVGAVKFDIQFEEGIIFISNLNFIFKDSVIFNFRDVSLIVDNNQLKFIGDIIMDFKNMQNFYSHFQIKRNYRKNIGRINSSFVFNLDSNFFELNELKIDGVNKEILNQFLNNFNSKEKDFFNKVTIKNTIRDFFRVISSG